MGLRIIVWGLDFIREDAGQETRGDSICLMGISRSEDVIVYQSVVV